MGLDLFGRLKKKQDFVPFIAIKNNVPSTFYDIDMLLQTKFSRGNAKSFLLNLINVENHIMIRL